jgi:hypothetical protein
MVAGVAGDPYNCPVRLLWATLVVVGSASGALAQAPGDSTRPRLFDVTAPLHLTLTADFGALARDRGERKQDHPAVLAVAGGDSLRLDVALRTRGHYRLRTCQYPPLKVVFAKGSTSGTVFAHQNALKLVVQCRGGGHWGDYLLEEYLLYRVYGLVAERSFRIRLVEVTYVEPGSKHPPETRRGFFVEDDDRMAHRNHSDVFEQQGVSQEETDSAQMNLLAVFEYLAGNTDWSVGGLHNIVLIRDSMNVVYPVPYDFDWSGAIAPPYAFPDSRLPIRTVRERLFRAGCRTPEQLAPAFAQFNERRDAIAALYRGQDGLDPGRVKQALDYFDEFYRTINDAAAARRAFSVNCTGPR